MTTYPNNIEIARRLLEQQKTINELRAEVAALLSVLTEGIGPPSILDFPGDLEMAAELIRGRRPDRAAAMLAKAGAIRAVVAGVGGGA